MNLFLCFCIYTISAQGVCKLDGKTVTVYAEEPMRLKGTEIVLGKFPASQCFLGRKSVYLEKD